MSEALAARLGRLQPGQVLPLDVNDEENVGDLFLMIDNTLQYGEDADIVTKDFDEYNDEIPTES